MPFQVSPGVSIREIDLTTTVPAVSTTDGATVIDSQMGPINEVVLVSSEQDLIRIFGRPSSDPDDTSHISWLGASNFLNYGNKLRVVRANNAGPNAKTGGGVATKIINHNHFTETVKRTSQVEWIARAPGTQGNSLKVSVADSTGAFTNSAIATVNADATHTTGVGYWARGNTSVRVDILNDPTIGGQLMDSSGRLAIQVGDYISFPGETYASQQYRVGSIAASEASSGIMYSNTITFFPALVEDIADDAVVRRDWEYARFFDRAPTKTAWASGLGTLQNPVTVTDDAMHIAIVDVDGNITGQRDTVLEAWDGLSKAKNARDPETGRVLYYQDAINERSSYIYWGDEVAAHPTGASGSWGTTVGSDAVTFGSTKYSNTRQLSGGTISAPTDANMITAFDQFRNAEDIDISVIFTNDASTEVQKHVIDNIVENRKDCVVTVSPPSSAVVPTGSNTPETALTNVLTWRNTTLGVSSSYAIADSGWKYVLDKYSNKFRWIPLNSDVAGCIVRTDTERDPWFSPSGYNRGQIKNAVKLAWSPNKAQRDDLYRADVNPVVTFPGRGNILFGDKTLYGRSSAFDRINVRRLFIVLEKAISTASKFLLFEHNDEFTRAQFRNMVEPFLRDVQGRRGITDFKVVCDETNNVPSVIDRNEFVGDIYIKPSRSINYIQLNFIAAATGVDFNEIVGITS